MRPRSDQRSASYSSSNSHIETSGRSARQVSQPARGAEISRGSSDRRRTARTLTLILSRTHATYHAHAGLIRTISTHHRCARPSVESPDDQGASPTVESSPPALVARIELSKSIHTPSPMLVRVDGRCDCLACSYGAPCLLRTSTLVAPLVFQLICYWDIRRFTRSPVSIRATVLKFMAQARRLPYPVGPARASRCASRAPASRD